MSRFTPNCLPLLIGSLPLDDHQVATDLIFEKTPEFPLWPQLPRYRQEGMIRQFAAGMPGLVEKDDKIFIDTSAENFEAEVLAFYEEYLMVTEAGAPLETSRFALSEYAARGFHTLLATAAAGEKTHLGLKGQITGPITFATTLVDQQGRAIYYDDQLRDIAVKHLQLIARYQAACMAEQGGQSIVFFDEPGLAGLGSSAFITVTHDDIVACLEEVFSGVRDVGGLTGVHVCANTEWPVLFASGVDIISYDAYGYFDRFVLFPDQLKAFMEKGGVLASGIIPTNPEYIGKEDVASLLTKWNQQADELVRLGVPRETVWAQSFITPSCGTGAVTLDEATRVIDLTKGVSEKVRDQFITGG